MSTITQKVCFILVCVLTLTSCSQDGESKDLSADLKSNNLVDYAAYSKIELEILSAVNTHRESIGLSSLKKVDDITFQAADHNHYMIGKSAVSHDNFQKRYATLVNEIGAVAVSENVGFGYSSAAAVVRAWINSEGHKANIEGNYTHFGVSVEQDASGKNYFTNIFVRR